MANYDFSYNSFSGTDIRAVFANKIIGEIQEIAFSIQREKVPLFALGNSNPQGFGRGKRGIGGILTFIMFDRHALLSEFSEKKVLVPITYRSPGVEITSDNLSVPYEDENKSVKVIPPDYVDQIPPFEIILVGANEYGSMIDMTFYGVELLDESSGVSVDDIAIDQRHSFVCRSIKKWQSLGKYAGMG